MIWSNCGSHHNEGDQDSGDQMVGGGWKKCDLGIEAYHVFDRSWGIFCEM